MVLAGSEVLDPDMRLHVVTPTMLFEILDRELDEIAHIAARSSDYRSFGRALVKLLPNAVSSGIEHMPRKHKENLLSEIGLHYSELLYAGSS